MLLHNYVTMENVTLNKCYCRNLKCAKDMYCIFKVKSTSIRILSSTSA